MAHKNRCFLVRHEGDQEGELHEGDTGDQWIRNILKKIERK